MRRIALVCLLGACGGDAGPTGPITARITHYDYSFDVDSRVSHAALTAELDVGGDCLTLPFRATELDPATVTIDGKAATATIDGSTVQICGSGYDAGQTILLETSQTIPLETLAPTQVGYSTKRSLGKNYYFMFSWINGCDQFGPCDSAPDKFASYTFHVTHPAGFTARCPGTITEVSDTETTCDTGFDGPTYSTFGVVVSDAWTQTPMGNWGTPKITVYDRANGANPGKIDQAYHAGFVSFMESLFGPYPYGDELRILFAPTYWAGFEQPGNIVILDNLPTTGIPNFFANYFAEVIDHEITHQWAGDRVTIAGTYDFFWKEATAEYMPYVYLDTVSATDAAKSPAVWKDGAVDAAYFPSPTDMPALVDFYGDAYNPGPMILYRQLEVLSSRQQVLDGLKAVLATPGARSVDDVISALATSTNLDLTAYTAAWIHGSGVPAWPEATITFTPAVTTSSLHVQLTRAPERRCKFHVSLRGANTGEAVDVAVDTFRDGPDQTIDVPTPAFTVTSTVLDPSNECLIYPTGTSQKPRPAQPWLDFVKWGRDAPPAL